MQQSQANSDRSYNLSVARLGVSQARAANAANKPLNLDQTTAAIRSGLESVKGGDGHVAPQDLAKAYKDFLSAGYTAKDFWSRYQGYWNPNQSSYEKQFYDAVNKG